MEVKGKVHKIGNSETFGNYEKREVVIKTDEQYPQTICIEFGQGKCNDYIDKLNLGDEVKISINLGSREWTNSQGEVKYFNSIKGWKIEKLGAPENYKEIVEKSKVFAPEPTEEEFDLPFK